MVTHTKSNILQYNEYYPFGLQTANSWTRENASNRYLYNGGNELNENSGWYETFFREYDAALGRFMQVDPLASSFASSSPYHYAYNNPMLYNDVLGDSSESNHNIGPGEFVNRALNHSRYGGTWSYGHATYFSSDGEAFAAGVDYVFQTNSWGNTYYGSYEATIVGYEALTTTGQLLSPESVQEALRIFRSGQENIYQKVNRKFGGTLEQLMEKDAADKYFNFYRLRIALPPRYHNADDLVLYYKGYLEVFEHKIFFDLESKDFDIHAVGFDITITRPDGSTEISSHNFEPSYDPFQPIFINPGNISDSGMGFPIETHTGDGALVGVIVTFQPTGMK